MDQTSGSSWEPAVDPAAQNAPSSQKNSFVPDVNADEPVAASSKRDHGAGAKEEEAEADSLAEPRQSNASEASQPDAIEFRIERPGAPLRRLRLTGHRYTLGSAAGCSIRLNDPSLRPMHAVLIRENARLLVRAYSVPIEINNVRITEAELHPGDVLRLGDYRFELLRHEGDETESESVSSNRPVTELEPWRERDEACHRREQRCEEREVKLRDREEDLQSLTEQLKEREAKLHAEESATIDLQQELAEQKQQLEELRETNQQQQESFSQRDAEFSERETDYQQRLEEATQQLTRTQEELQKSSRSVEEMREQIDSLNQQLEEISQQRTELEVREREQQREHEQLVAQLEEARDQALAGQAESDAQRREAESKLQEMESFSESLEKDRGAERETHLAKLAASEQAAEALRKQVEALQQSLNQATDASDRLRVDHEEAQAKVADLESAVTQAAQESAQQRDHWKAEADELRASVERLSTELKQATQDLSELRDANAVLTARLEEMQQQRDAARADAESRPTGEAYQSLQQEINLVNDQLAQTQQDYQDVLDQRDHDHRSRDLEPSSPAIDNDKSASGTAEPSELCKQGSGEFVSIQPAPHSLASLLIKDLDDEAEAERQHEGQASPPGISSSDDSVSEGSQEAWGRERREAADATASSSDPNGNRVEDLQSDDPDDSNEQETLGGNPASDAEVSLTGDGGQDENELFESSLGAEASHDVKPEHVIDEDDSIEDYMNRLLQRVQGKPPEDLPQPSVSKPKPDTKPAETPQKAVAVTPETATKEPYVPRSMAPEQMKSLSAMRELANSSAQIAISHSLRVQTRDTQIKGAISLACAAGAIVCGIACYLFLPGMMRYLAAAMTVLVAAIYAREGWLLFREASRRLRAASMEQLDQKAEQESGDQA